MVASRDEQGDSVELVRGHAVLRTRLVLLGWTEVAAILLATAVALWVLLVGPVLAHWRTPTTGVSLLLTVAAQSLAVLAGALAVHARTPWLTYWALVPFGLGVASYAFVLARFDRRQLAIGRGDQWITGGALAISALAAGDLATAAGALGVPGRGHAAVEFLAVALWVAAMLWLPVLLLGEALRPRLVYSRRRWSTVFPIGMYAACSFVVGSVAHAEAITTFGRVWVWVALAVWAAVSGAAVRSKSVRSRTHRRARSA